MTHRGGRTAGQWWDVNDEYVTVSLEALRTVGSAAYRWAGASKADADYLFGMYMDKAMQGDHLRGLGLVPKQVRNAKKGRPNFRLKARLVRKGRATAMLDPGAKGSPQLACRDGMALAIRKAGAHGVGLVTVRGPGRTVGHYVKQAAEAGFIGFACVQTVPSVAPLGGFQAMLGNGPTAFGIPAGKYDPIILDMSFTTSSGKGIRRAAVEGTRIPEGLLLDPHGRPTTDPAQFLGTNGKPKGTLVPLGGHKGYAMLYVIGLLTTTLADASPAWDLGDNSGARVRQGTLLMAIDPTAFVPAKQFRTRVDRYIAKVAAAPRKTGVTEILYPGQRSQALRRKCERAGTVAIPVTQHREMVALAYDIGLAGVL